MSASTPQEGAAPPAERTPVKGNPGWAGETGEFAHLSEDDVRGTAYVGVRPLEGGHPGGASSYPYQIAERDPDAPLFEGPYRERFEKILTRYPNKQGALLPALNLAQEVRGHLSPEALNRVAELLELAPAYVRGVATFYTMYNKRPVGRYLVQVCTNVCCNVCGADEVAEAFLEQLGAEMGDVSEDGLFTVMEAECLGACGFPTVVQVNNRYFENVEAAAVPDLIARLRTEGVSTPQPARAGTPDRAAGAPAERAATPQAHGAEKAG
ncbi:MAG TPA: NAD(P)H-dependent oxidoreductase subunit E, partial [Longimicrobiales bacterium]|nr:NAD(P)H-dependent oxidoreductase subunit E [Longimicrobiales bacterium]